MKYYIGIDGGGTKTAFTIAKSDAVALKTIYKSGCSYKEIGIDNVLKLLTDGVKELLQNVNASLEECAGCCIGLPCYGESPDFDIVIKEKIEKALLPLPVHIVNDAVVGWAGSLECSEGVHLVSGTGAVAYAQSDDGREARSNGWSEFFSDEGSSYWVGKEAMSLFAQEADGRKEKGALYEIVKKELNLKNDIEFIDIIEKDYAPFRDKVASFQLLAEKAALAGDKETIKIYDEAAQHLADSAYGVIRQLGWQNKEVTVSYFGGLFKAGDLILKPLKERLLKMNCIVAKPLHTAIEGALLLSIKKFR